MSVMSLVPPQDVPERYIKDHHLRSCRPGDQPVVLSNSFARHSLRLKCALWTALRDCSGGESLKGGLVGQQENYQLVTTVSLAAASGWSLFSLEIRAWFFGVRKLVDRMVFMMERK